MKYLARGLGPQAKRRYILTDKPESNDWNQLNITPIGYSPIDGHRALYEAVGRWASRSRSGLLDRQSQMQDIVNSVRPQDLSAEQRSLVESTITDEKSVEFFCAHARGQDWLNWIAVRPEFRQLFDKKAESTAITWRLATWFARTYVTAETSELCVDRLSCSWRSPRRRTLGGGSASAQPPFSGTGNAADDAQLDCASDPRRP